VITCQADVEEPFIITKVQVDLSPVIEDINLSVLERVHGTSIDVQVRVYLYRGDIKTP
jgi:hypothetical protein